MLDRAATTAGVEYARLHRRRAARQMIGGLAASTVTPSALILTPEALAARAAMASRLDGAIAGLEAQPRLLLLLHLDGYSFEDAADITGVSLAVARDDTHRGVEQLRALLREEAADANSAPSNAPRKELHIDVLRRVWRELREGAPTTKETPDPAVISDALHGALTPADRVRVLDGAMRGGAADDVALFFGIRQSCAVIPEIRLAPAWGLRIWVGAVATILASTLVLPLWRMATMPPAARAASGASVGDETLTLLTTEVRMSDSLRLTWRPTRDVDSYLLEVLDATTIPLATLVTRDTIAAVARAEKIVNAPMLRWRVTARRRDGSAVRSNLQTLTRAKLNP
jgi:hypothetical protein